MADTDYLNGLNVVPLSKKSTQKWTRSAIASPPEHPWRHLYKNRKEPPEVGLPPDTKSMPPLYYRNGVFEPRMSYKGHAHYVKANGRYTAKSSGTVRPFTHETVRLCDVQAFRNCAAKKVAQADVNNNAVAALTDGMARLSTSSPSIRPVIYRYVDVIKNSLALLEAIHFELFMPDRPDLRFLGIPLFAVPSGTLEGDYFRVSDVDLLPNSSFGVNLGQNVFPVVWKAKCAKMKFSKVSFHETEGLAYILNKKADISGAVVAVSEHSDREFLIRSSLFPNDKSRKEHSIVRASMRDLGTAQIYAVEPPKPGSNPPMKKMEKKGVAIGKVDEKKGKKNKHKKKEEEKEFDPRSEYQKLVWDVRTSSSRAGRVVSAVRALSATEAERVKDRLGAFAKYGRHGDLKLMDELFRLGSTYREFDSRGVDKQEAGEILIDESIILKTIRDKGLGNLKMCRGLLDCIHGGGPGKCDAPKSSLHKCGDITLNAAQSRALRLYVKKNGPRVFCILSPPGSGKTTVAAAMSAKVGRTTVARTGNYKPKYGPRETYTYYDGVQLLLSVQNVAVDNMGAALKKMDYGEGEVYNMKSARKLNPSEPAAYDFFDLMEEQELSEWINGSIQVPEAARRRMREENRRRAREKGREGRKPMTELEACITHYRRKFERTVEPKIILSTVEMVLYKMYTESKLVNHLRRVRRVIIDEASLLTEAALFCIIRRFPEARIVLIGDDKQLPPFMFDEKILGQELAGRPGLSVAMKTGKVPVVELNEVYRAPKSLVAPYNRLAYGGRLVSRKAEGERPLSSIGLIRPGKPQLLLIDVDGKHKRNKSTMSLSNEKEVQALQRLLKKFPGGWKKKIMIICLYKDQQKRLESVLSKDDYTILTVDSAQGKEKPIVILMTTRTTVPGQGSFFDSPERCNVAVSRQQEALIVLGKDDFLIAKKPWRTVVNWDDFTVIKAANIV
ncbi:hypothetical protein PRIPAC_83079 [Pristionchus pacificus]|nr:hypothetical protein PRIPAC_83079 [Pristionchus pacificus]